MAPSIQRVVAPDNSLSCRHTIDIPDREEGGLALCWLGLSLLRLGYAKGRVLDGRGGEGGISHVTSILRNINVALLNLRIAHVTLSVMSNVTIACH